MVHAWSAWTTATALGELALVGPEDVLGLATDVGLTSVLGVDEGRTGAVEEQPAIATTPARTDATASRP